MSVHPGGGDTKQFEVIKNVDRLAENFSRDPLAFISEAQDILDIEGPKNSRELNGFLAESGLTLFAYGTLLGKELVDNGRMNSFDMSLAVPVLEAKFDGINSTELFQKTDNPAEAVMPLFEDEAVIIDCLNTTFETLGLKAQMYVSTRVGDGAKIAYYGNPEDCLKLAQCYTYVKLARPEVAKYTRIAVNSTEHAKLIYYGAKFSDVVNHDLEAVLSEVKRRGREVGYEHEVYINGDFVSKKDMDKRWLTTNLRTPGFEFADVLGTEVSRLANSIKSRDGEYTRRLFQIGMSSGQVKPAASFDTSSFMVMISPRNDLPAGELAEIMREASRLGVNTDLGVTADLEAGILAIKFPMNKGYTRVLKQLLEIKEALGGKVSIVTGVSNPAVLSVPNYGRIPLSVAINTAGRTAKQTRSEESTGIRILAHPGFEKPSGAALEIERSVNGILDMRLTGINEDDTLPEVTTFLGENIVPLAALPNDHALPNVRSYVRLGLFNECAFEIEKAVALGGFQDEGMPQVGTTQARAIGYYQAEIQRGSLAGSIIESAFKYFKYGFTSKEFRSVFQTLYTEDFHSTIEELEYLGIFEREGDLLKPNLRIIPESYLINTSVEELDEGVMSLVVMLAENMEQETELDYIINGFGPGKSLMYAGILSTLVAEDKSHIYESLRSKLLMNYISHRFEFDRVTPQDLLPQINPTHLSKSDPMFHTTLWYLYNLHPDELHGQYRDDFLAEFKRIEGYILQNPESLKNTSFTEAFGRLRRYAVDRNNIDSSYLEHPRLAAMSLVTDMPTLVGVLGQDLAFDIYFTRLNYILDKGDSLSMQIALGTLYTHVGGGNIPPEFLKRVDWVKDSHPLLNTHPPRDLSEMEEAWVSIIQNEETSDHHRVQLLLNYVATYENRALTTNNGNPVNNKAFNIFGEQLFQFIVNNKILPSQFNQLIINLGAIYGRILQDTSGSEELQLRNARIKLRNIERLHQLLPMIVENSRSYQAEGQSGWDDYLNVLWNLLLLTPDFRDYEAMGVGIPQHHQETVEQVLEEIRSKLSGESLGPHQRAQTAEFGLLVAPLFKAFFEELTNTREVIDVTSSFNEAERWIDVVINPTLNPQDAHTYRFTAQRSENSGPQNRTSFDVFYLWLQHTKIEFRNDLVVKLAFKILLEGQFDRFDLIG